MTRRKVGSHQGPLPAPHLGLFQHEFSRFDGEKSARIAVAAENAADEDSDIDLRQFSALPVDGRAE